MFSFINQLTNNKQHCFDLTTPVFFSAIKKKTYILVHVLVLHSLFNFITPHVPMSSQCIFTKKKCNTGVAWRGCQQNDKDDVPRWAELMFRQHHGFGRTRGEYESRLTTGLWYKYHPLYYPPRKPDRPGFEYAAGGFRPSCLWLIEPRATQSRTLLCWGLEGNWMCRKMLHPGTWMGRGFTIQKQTGERSECPFRGPPSAIHLFQLHQLVWNKSNVHAFLDTFVFNVCAACCYWSVLVWQDLVARMYSSDG